MIASCQKLLLPLAVCLLPTVAVYADPDIHDTRLLTQTGRQRPARGVHLCRQPLGRRPRRQQRPPADQRLGRRLESGLLAGWERIAFSAQYEGNTDVYMVPVSGGSPRG